MEITVSRKAHFNAAHRLHNKNWSDEKNQKVFGKCNYQNYHGHNYVLETWLEGPIDPVTGFVYDLGELKKLIRKEVTERFDHKNLNLDCPEFKSLNPTAENIAKIIWNILRENLNNNLKLTVKLWETENNIVEYSGE